MRMRDARVCLIVGPKFPLTRDRRGVGRGPGGPVNQIVNVLLLVHQRQVVPEAGVALVAPLPPALLQEAHLKPLAAWANQTRGGSIYSRAGPIG
eukprot:5577298-Pyramimonas_sp.AAC.1